MVHLGIRINKETKKLLEKEAEKQQRSVSNLVRIIIEKYLKK